MPSYEIPVYMHLLFRKVREQIEHPEKHISFKDMIKMTVKEEFGGRLAKFSPKDIGVLYAYITEKVEEYLHTVKSPPSINVFKNFVLMEIRYKIDFLDMIVQKRDEVKLRKFPARRKSTSKSNADVKDVMDIKSTSSNFYNMRFFGLEDGTVKYRKAPDSCNDSLIRYQDMLISSKLKFANIINWPNVRIKFKTNIVEFTRSVNYNVSHHLSTDPNSVIVAENECDELFFNSPESVSASSLFHVPLLGAYLRLILDSLASDKCDLPVWSRDQIRHFVQIMRKDCEKLGDAYCQNTYTYHTNHYNYFRVFKNTERPPPDLAVAGASVLHLVETINPEVEFCFQQCSFAKPMTASDEAKLCGYFQAISQQKSEAKELYDVLRKSLSYQCTVCWVVFTGAMALQTFIKHTVKHVCNRKWACGNCKQEFDQLELAAERKIWHECRK